MENMGGAMLETVAWPYAYIYIIGAMWNCNIVNIHKIKIKIKIKIIIGLYLKFYFKWALTINV